MLLLDKTKTGTIVSGSEAALHAAVLAGDEIRIGLDAVDAYREILRLGVTGYDYNNDLSFGMVRIAHSGEENLKSRGDKFMGGQDYDMFATFVSDRSSFHSRRKKPWSSWGTGPVTANKYGSKAAKDRYGYYRWYGTGKTRSVVASSDDAASMFQVLADIHAGTLDDYKIRLTMRDSVGGNLFCWIASDTILYDVKRPPEPNADTWLMASPVTDPAKPAWTVKLEEVPIPVQTSNSPRLASFADNGNLTTLIVANVIAHAGGYASFHGLPVRLDGLAYEYTTPYTQDFVSPKTLVEVLGPLV